MRENTIKYYTHRRMEIGCIECTYSQWADSDTKDRVIRESLAVTARDLRKLMIYLVPTLMHSLLIQRHLPRLLSLVVISSLINCESLRLKVHELKTDLDFIRIC